MTCLACWLDKLQPNKLDSLQAGGVHEYCRGSWGCHAELLLHALSFTAETHAVSLPFTALEDPAGTGCAFPLAYHAFPTV